MILRETVDAAYIKAVITHPAIWQWVSDDDCIEQDYWPVIHEAISYLVPESDGVALGVLMLIKCNAVTVELHTALLPEHRKDIVEVFAKLKEWASDKGYTRIRTWIPAHNRHAYAASKRVGFELVGTEAKAFKKDGHLHDLHLFGVTLCQQQQ